MTYSVTVRDEETGGTSHVSGLESSNPLNAVRTASLIRQDEWQPGSAPISFYQLDPELDSFSYGYFSRLEDAQTAGLHDYRRHMESMRRPIGDIAYAQAPKREADPEAPDIWNIIDSAYPDRHITLGQIVACELWTSPDPIVNPGPQ